MRKFTFLTILILTLFFHLFVQAQQTLNINRQYQDISLLKSDTLIYKLPLLKGNIYQFSILQQGISVYYKLISSTGEKVRETWNGY